MNRHLRPIDHVSRRAPLVVRAGLLLLCMLRCTPALAADVFDFSDVILRAERLAAAPFKKSSSNLPRELQTLTYDQYRDIRFKPDRALWHGTKLPFELEFFHEGWNVDQPVKISEVTGERVHEIEFNPDAFDYGATKIDPNRMRGLGFAGFRVHYPINTPTYKDEVLVFLGASYFRAIGTDQRYGLSARGLAVDTALSSGEEFPRFVEFWIERPGLSATDLTIYGLLDSLRVTAAYRFILKPGVTTTMDVTVRLYLREEVGTLGLAPLTSMFLFGENQHPSTDDYRPAVHDSDGLSIHSSTGEWIWRPLVNPKHLLVTSFTMTNPQGFGLMQRGREFWHYEDLEARYDLRPSAWIEPKGDWGAGRVELVQIPVPDETNDNIVAYWVPSNPPAPKHPYDLRYRVSWQKDPETRPPLSWVAQTRRGWGYMRHPDNSIGFTVDFDGPALRKLPPSAKVDGVVSVDSNGELLEHHAYPNPITGGWRLTLRVRRLDTAKPVELRGSLRSDDKTLSETWTYILPPD